MHAKQLRVHHMDSYFQNKSIPGSNRQHPAQQLVNALVSHGTFEVQEPRWQHFVVLAWIAKIVCDEKRNPIHQQCQCLWT